MALDSQLGLLTNVGLLIPAEEQQELIFRHALLQDAAYESLLRQDRRVLHRRVARALEQIYPERIDTLAPVLGQHYAEAGDGAAARAWYLRAASAAAATYALPEAVALYARAYRLAVQDGLGGAELAELVRRYGRALELLSHYHEALALYQELEQHAQTRDDRRLLLDSLLLQALIAVSVNVAHDEQRGRQLLERALELAYELGDLRGEARAEWCLLLLEGFQHNQGRAIRHGERSLALARQSGDKEQTALALSDLAAYGYLMVGSFDKALAALEEACGLWRELGDLPMLANALSSLVRVTTTMGQYDLSLRYGEEAFELSSRANNPWGQASSLMMRGLIEIERGQLEQGIASTDLCITLGDRSGFQFASVANRSLSAMFWTQLGLLDRADALMTIAEERAARIPMLQIWTQAAGMLLELERDDLDAAERAFVQTEGITPAESLSATLIPFMTIAQALLLERRGEQQRGLALLDEAREIEQRHGILFALLPTERFRAELLWRAGRRPEALAALDRALTLAEDMGAHWQLWQLLALRATITGEEQERHQAQVILDALIGAITDPMLRQTLRHAPLVTRLLSDERI